MPNTDASNFVAGVDWAFIFIMGISALFLLAITGVMLYFVYRYHESRNPVPTELHGSNRLEIIWTVIPTLLAMVMFYYGWKGWYPMRNPPPDALVIKGTAMMWKFSFEYPNGKTSDMLVVPKGKAVRVDVKALDVLHSFYIPGFRIKQDAVPGKDNYIWFISNRPGTYDLFCTEYCGLKHSYMNALVKVVSPARYDEWVKEGEVALAPGEKAKPGAMGKRLYEKFGCLACHSIDGSRIVGPSFKGIYGEKVTVLTDGKERTITVDDEYIKRSVYDPNADVVKGFAPNQMTSYKALIKEEEVKEIAEFIKTLNVK